MSGTPFHYLDILFEDDYLVAVNKPNGLLVHNSSIAREASEFALQILRNQLGYYVHPVHRLDRKTSGVLLFVKDKTLLPLMQNVLQMPSTEKKYLALVRGFFPDYLVVDYALTNDRNKTQDAVTTFQLITHFEIPLAFQGFQTSRYSLIEAFPKTGRYHQIRKHCKHVFHPILGDRPHGCNKQNKLFLEQFQSTNMFLHASKITFFHPIDGKELQIEAPLPAFFANMLSNFNQTNQL